MIHIEQNQSISENENIFVASPTGDYEDNALIEFYNSEDPEKILGAFAAQYVKYGGLVYKFNDPKELGAEILKLEPESTHSAASFVRMQNELLKQFNQGNLEPESLNQAMADEQIKMEENMTALPAEEATTTPAVNGTSTQATTTLPVNEDPLPNLITTTQPITSQTTTAPVINATTTPTTTPEIIPTSTANTTSATSTATSTNPVEQFFDNLLNATTTPATTTPEIIPTSTANTTSAVEMTTSTNPVEQLINVINENTATSSVVSEAQATTSAAQGIINTTSTQI